jgi:pimeloyl-ACP methyl ester carboxylesterase
MTSGGTDAKKPPIVVLIHGAWHGAWCWSGVAAELDRRGIPSVAIDLPGHGSSLDEVTGLYGDAAVLEAWVRRSGRRVILVGHSYGGAVITQGATPDLDVAGLVYVAAFQLDTGESVLGFLGSAERRVVALAAAQAPGPTPDTLVLDPDSAVAALYGDADPAVARAAVQRLVPEATASFTETITHLAPDVAWRRVPSTYVLCRRDEAIHPDHQMVMAERAETVVALDADHSPFLTDPRTLADVIEGHWRSSAAAEPSSRTEEEPG